MAIGDKFRRKKNLYLARALAYKDGLESSDISNPDRTRYNKWKEARGRVPMMSNDEYLTAMARKSMSRATVDSSARNNNLARFGELMSSYNDSRADIDQLGKDLSRQNAENAIEFANEAAGYIQNNLIPDAGMTALSVLPFAGAARAAMLRGRIPATKSYPTRREASAVNRIFDGGSPMPSSSPDAFIANDPNRIYRLTGKSQVDDIINSGYVRPKVGKIKGGRSGEIHWSSGADNLKYRPQDDMYIISPKNKVGNNQLGAIESSDIDIWRGINGKWEKYDISKNIKK